MALGLAHGARREARGASSSFTGWPAGRAPELLLAHDLAGIELAFGLFDGGVQCGPLVLVELITLVNRQHVQCGSLWGRLVGSSTFIDHDATTLHVRLERSHDLIIPRSASCDTGSARPRSGPAYDGAAG